MDRPFGVTLLASFFFVQSILNVFIVYSYYVLGAPAFPIVFYTLDSVAGFALSYGLWKGLMWGKIGTMILSGLEILVGVLGTYLAIGIEPSSPTQALTKLVVYAIVIYFLTRPEIGDYFKK
jgi:hypothetical protein